MKSIVKHVFKTLVLVIAIIQIPEVIFGQLTFSQDGKTLAYNNYSYAARRKVDFWEMEKGEKIQSLPSKGRGAITFTNQENVVYINGEFIDILSGKVIETVPNFGAKSPVLLTPNESGFLAVNERGTLIFLDRQSYEVEDSVKLKLPNINDQVFLAITPNMKYIYVMNGYNDTKAFQIDAASFEVNKTLDVGIGRKMYVNNSKLGISRPWVVGLGKEYNTLFFGSHGNGTKDFWTDGYGENHEIVDFAYHPTDENIKTWVTYEKIYIVDPKKKKPIKISLKAKAYFADGIAYSPDGSVFAVVMKETSKQDGSLMVNIYDAKTYKLKKTIKEPKP